MSNEKNLKQDNDKVGQAMSKSNTRNSKRGKRSRTARRQGKPNSGAKTSRNDIGDSNGGNTYSVDNDFSWYNTVPELTAAASSFPFSRPLGTRIEYDNYADKSTKTNIIPGIMTLNWFPTVGIATDGSDPVNIVSREIYSFVRYANSGSSNYDATDLMLYLLAIDSANSMYVAATRVYGLANLYTPENRYMPQKLVEALGWDFDDVLGNMAQFRWAINNIAYKLSALAVPNFMSYYIRHLWMNSGVYTDKPSGKAQIYAYKQTHYYQYNNGTKGESLRLTHTAVPSKLTVSKWLTFMNDIINPLLASEDIGIMSGDIIKAFGMDNLFQVKPIDIDFVSTPMYSEEVLTQITNATPMGKPMASFEGNNRKYSWDVWTAVSTATAEGWLCSGGAVYLGRTGKVNASHLSFAGLDRLITSNSDRPEPSEIMVATRMTNSANTIVKAGSGETETPCLTWSVGTQCSTEILSSISVVTMNVQYEMCALNHPELMGVVDDICKFDWCPTLAIYNASGEFTDYYQDTNNYTVMKPADLTRLHEAALISEFYVPQIASLTRRPMGK